MIGHPSVSILLVDVAGRTSLPWQRLQCSWTRQIPIALLPLWFCVLRADWMWQDHQSSRRCGSLVYAVIPRGRWTRPVPLIRLPPHARHLRWRKRLVDDALTVLAAYDNRAALLNSYCAFRDVARCPCCGSMVLLLSPGIYT